MVLHFCSDQTIPRWIHLRVHLCHTEMVWTTSVICTYIFSSMNSHCSIQNYGEKHEFSSVSSARTAEFTRVPCCIPGGETRVGWQLHTYKLSLFLSFSLLLSLFWMLCTPVLSWNNLSPFVPLVSPVNFSLFQLAVSSFPRTVSWKPPERHQANGAVGSAVKRRRRSSPGPIIVIKDEPEDDISYVRRGWTEKIQSNLYFT